MKVQQGTAGYISAKKRQLAVTEKYGTKYHIYTMKKKKLVMLEVTLFSLLMRLK